MLCFGKGREWIENPWLVHVLRTSASEQAEPCAISRAFPVSDKHSALLHVRGPYFIRVEHTHTCTERPAEEILLSLYGYTATRRMF